MNKKKYKKPIVVMNFSGVYESEKFYQNENYLWIDCKKIKGKDCYCDDDAITKIKTKIKNIPYNTLHFIDSGNFHYMTKFWTDKIKSPFYLVVFDYHSDMQKPIFGNILSCGSWISRVIEENDFLEKVILIGVDKMQQPHINKIFKDKVICINDEDIHKSNLIKKISNKLRDSDMYISIDKDVLSEKYIKTNWNQGSMNKKELKVFLQNIVAKKHILGVDICGETQNVEERTFDIKENSVFNKKIISFFKENIYD